MTWDEIVEVVRNGNGMSWGDWDLASPRRRPSGVWVDLGDGKNLNIPGTKTGPKGIQLLPASDGQPVPALTTQQRDELDL